MWNIIVTGRARSMLILDQVYVGDVKIKTRILARRGAYKLEYSHVKYVINSRAVRLFCEARKTIRSTIYRAIHCKKPNRPNNVDLSVEPNSG